MSPSRSGKEARGNKNPRVKWCGYCGVSHHLEAKCLGPGGDKSLWCSICGMTTNSHLKGCTGSKGVSHLCYHCRKPGHIASACKKCDYCGKMGHKEPCPERRNEPQCNKCGSQEHMTRFCRVHTKIRRAYDEMIKNDPIESIDESLYSPGYTQAEINEHIWFLQEEKQDRQTLVDAVRRGVSEDGETNHSGTPRRRINQCPVYEPRRRGNQINPELPRSQWMPFRDSGSSAATPPGIKGKSVTEESGDQHASQSSGHSGSNSSE